MNALILSLYAGVLGLLALYGMHRFWILYLYWRYYKAAPRRAEPPVPAVWPMVTVQLPVYNEMYVLDRLLDAVCALDYPRERLEIQLLDDSTDESRELAQRLTEAKRLAGYDVRCVQRKDRFGYKAGALGNGLATARGEFVAIFDADFLPSPDFLKRTVPHFADPGLGMVQTRWGHVNGDYSLLTRLQALFLDGHFVLEHTARNRSGAFFNFNGTAGVWRRRTIDEAGGWMDDTLTEDLDISYRAQMKGWRFLFLPEVVCPAELPVDVCAFRNQQHRWTKGALQVAKKILPSLWRSPLPFFVKLESTVHLTSNVGYLLVLVYTCLVPPALWARRGMDLPAWSSLAELAVFVMTTVSIAVFYSVARREAFPGRPLILRWTDIPILMGFGLGMCVNNGRAVLGALFNVPTEFRRTAKFDIRRPGQSWREKRYRLLNRRVGWPEMLGALYVGAAFLACLATGYLWALPFLAILGGGYAYVGFLTWRHARQA